MQFIIICRYFIVNFVLILFIVLPVNGTSVEDSYFINYTISGNILLPGIGKFTANGELEVMTNELNITTKMHTLNYDTSIPEYRVAGSAIIMEDRETRFLHKVQDTNVIIDYLWNYFSNNGTQKLKSIFQISKDEIDGNSVKILNYTVPIVGETGFYAPDLGYRIKSYKLKFSDGPNSFIIYYDISNLVLIGFSVAFSISIENDQLLLFDVTVIINKSNLKFITQDSNLITNLVYPLFILGGLLIIKIIINNYYNRKNSRLIEGGLR